MDENNMNKDDRIKALEENYKAIIDEKDVIIQRYDRKLREMSQELQQL